MFYILEVKKIVKYLNLQEFELNEEKNKRDWEMVSRIFDRICMIFFLTACIIIVVYNSIDLYIMYREQVDEDIHANPP